MSMGNEGKDKICVNMFGGLAITYEGKNVSIGKNKTAKYIQLLEMVWLSGGAGIPKDQLMNTLYDREEQSNLSNSFNNLIYQMHKQLDKSGLPEHEYIVNKDGIFFTDDTIDIESDVQRFVSNIEKARSFENEEDGIEYYRAAFDEYRAEILPELSTQEWFIVKSVQLQKMYAESVVALGAYYSVIEDYNSMYRIFKKAAELYPDDEWQVGEINALIGMGSYTDAYAVYDETVRYYTDELGVTPSKELHILIHHYHNIPFLFHFFAH